MMGAIGIVDRRAFAGGQGGEVLAGGGDFQLPRHPRPRRHFEETVLARRADRGSTGIFEHARYAPAGRLPR